MKQYETLRFVADAAGQQRKVQVLTMLGNLGWRVLSETIEHGHTKGGEACCLAAICLPLGFAASRTPNVAVVTIERDAPEVPAVIGMHQHAWRTFDDNRVFCLTCGLTEEGRV